MVKIISLSKEEAINLMALDEADHFPVRTLNEKGLHSLRAFAEKYIRCFSTWDFQALVIEAEESLGNFSLEETPQYEFSQFHTHSRRPEIIYFTDDELDWSITA